MSKRLLFICFAIVVLVFPSKMLALTVVVDPGHGGHDPGAIGVNGLKEKNINLDISNKLVKELNGLGYETIMTRESDQFMTLPERVTFANQSGGDIFVSVHSNAHPNSSARGTLVLYYDDTYQQADYPASSAMRMLSDENKKLATSIQEHVIKQVNTVNRGIIPSGVFVVRNGIMPSVLIEAAFLSNKDDAKLLASDSFRASVARGIAKGISKYQPPVFYDLNNHWAKEHILKLESLGVVSGDNGAFHPNRQMTRAEFITVLDKLFSFDGLLANSLAINSIGMQNIDDIVGVVDAVYGDGAVEVKVPKQFPDLTSEHWAYPIISKAIELGIINGFEDGTIRPNQPISRAEMVVLFDRIALADSPSSHTNYFEDVPEQSWYASSVYKMKELGYVQGSTETSFAPNRQLLRAEGATIISRYLGSDSGNIVMNSLKLGSGR